MLGRAGVSAVDHLGTEAEPLCQWQDLYLKPISMIQISVFLPAMTVPGQSISNWDLIEKLKKAISPIQLDSIKVKESNTDSVIFEAEVLSAAIMKRAMKKLDNVKMKVAGFSEPLKVVTKSANLEFPTSDDWDEWFLTHKVNADKPGERPDTLHLSKIPVKWFVDVTEKPSEMMIRCAMEMYGKVREVDIPMCDPFRIHMNPKISGIQGTGFGFGQDVFFEAYVQYADYGGFLRAMEELKDKKWAKKIDGKYFQATIKVDFDRNRHLSDENIKKRKEERVRIENEQVEKAKKENDEKKLEEIRKLREESEKVRRREERERKRREKKEEEERQKQEKEKKEREEKILLEKLKTEKSEQSERLIDCLFQRILEKEENRKKREELELKEALTKIDHVAEPVGKEEALRHALLKQREIRMRERLKAKMEEAVKESEMKSQKKSSRRRYSPSSSDSDSRSSSTSSSSEDEGRRRKKKKKSKKSRQRRRSEDRSKRRK